jgi:hypothetical protein
VTHQPSSRWIDRRRLSVGAQATTCNASLKIQRISNSREKPESSPRKLLAGTAVIIVESVEQLDQRTPSDRLGNTQREDMSSPSKSQPGTLDSNQTLSKLCTHANDTGLTKRDELAASIVQFDFKGMQWFQRAPHSA